MIHRLILQTLHSALMQNLLQAILGIRYRNRAALRKCPQFILVGNHNSHLDALSMLAAVPGRMIHRVHPVAAADYFGRTWWKRLISNTFINTILIPRKRPTTRGELDPMQLMEQALERGHSLILFPEGTRGEPGVMQQFKKGIGHLLQKYPHIPFIPTYLKGLEESLPKGQSIPKSVDAEIIFGEPCFSIGEKAESITTQVEQKVLELRDKVQDKK